MTVDAGEFLVATPLVEDLADSIIRQAFGKPFEPAPPDTGKSRRRILNASYLAIATLGVAGWLVRSEKAGKAGFLAYHLLLPLTLVIGIRRASATPFAWLWKFAPDAATALGFSAANMIASGACKAARGRRQTQGSERAT